MFIRLETKLILFVKVQTLLLHHYFDWKIRAKLSLHIGFLILSRKEFVNIMPAAFQREIDRREYKSHVWEKIVSSICCKIDIILSENRILQNESAIFKFILLLQASSYCLSILTCTLLKIKHVHGWSKEYTAISDILKQLLYQVKVF